LALRSIALIRSTYAASSPNVGGAICVTVAPHNQTAYIAATHRCPEGITMQALSPTRKPFARSAPPIRRDSLASSV
jgi:hypothetical protein